MTSGLFCAKAACERGCFPASFNVLSLRSESYAEKALCNAGAGNPKHLVQERPSHAFGHRGRFRSAAARWRRPAALSPAR